MHLVWCTVMYILLVFIFQPRLARTQTQLVGPSQFSQLPCVCDAGVCTQAWDGVQRNKGCRDNEGWPIFICADTVPFGYHDHYGDNCYQGRGEIRHFKQIWTRVIECEVCNWDWPRTKIYQAERCRNKIDSCYIYKCVERPPPQPPEPICKEDSQYCGSVCLKWGNSWSPCVCCDGERVHQWTEYLGPPGGVLYGYSCRPCDAGSMQQKKLHFDYACFDCHAGKYSKAGATVCLSCNPGTYSDAHDANCYYCAPGKYAPNENSAECTNCPAASSVYEMGSTNARDCKCKSDYTWDYMSHVSTNVPPDCQFCVGGKYKMDFGFQECTICPAGKYKAFGDNFWSSGLCCRPDCDNCPANSYSAAGSISCTVCGAGQYVESQGCTNCPAGKYLSGTACLSCQVNAWSLEGSTVCFCNAGYKCAYSNDLTELNFCFPCTKGQYSLNPGVVECTLCEAGKYKTLEGPGACTDCIAGKYSADVGAWYTYCSGSLSARFRDF